MSYDYANVTDFVSFLLLFNTYTNGIGWVVMVFVLGAIIFLTLKVNDINDSLMISSFAMCLLGMLLNFIGLITSYFIGVFFALFILSLVLKVIMK